MDKRSFPVLPPPAHPPPGHAPHEEDAFTPSASSGSSSPRSPFSPMPPLDTDVLPEKPKRPRKLSRRAEGRIHENRSNLNPFAYDFVPNQGLIMPSKTSRVERAGQELRKVTSANFQPGGIGESLFINLGIPYNAREVNAENKEQGGKCRNEAAEDIFAFDELEEKVEELFKELIKEDEKDCKMIGHNCSFCNTTTIKEDEMNEKNSD